MEQKLNKKILIRFRSFAGALVLLIALSCPLIAKTKDPLPSWNEGSAKQSILKFVKRVTNPKSPDFVPVPQRVAVFDNDGTLWVEKPYYVQLQFAVDRVRALAPQHPEWKTQEPFKSVLEGNLQGVAASGEEGILKLIMATHAGMTTDQFSKIVQAWIKQARHPRFNRPYTDLVYQPMLELLNYLRANGFKTYIVSGGGVEFMRPWTQGVYGIPPEQVVGSSIKIQFKNKGDKPALVRLAEINFINDKAGKPVGIQQAIGRRPIAAFGNSDGDLQMLQWTTLGNGPSFGMLIHHTDGKREWAYDRHSSVGKLDQALKEAKGKGWTVVDMKQDWKVIFP